MLIVGELINASRSSVAEAIKSQNAGMIENLAKDQYEAGAGFIDVNAGIFAGKEADYLQWLVENVQAAVDAPCCIDSPDPRAVEKALSVHKGTAMINSISLEKERFNTYLPLIAGTGLKVVALCMSDKGMPKTSDDRLIIADELINALVRNNVPLNNIYVDPLVQPIATEGNYGAEFLNAVEKIMTGFKGVHTICGLSNISYGLPKRRLLNRIFAVMAVAKGLDSLIINPLDKELMANLIAAGTLGGRDEFCENYLDAFRSQKLEF
ncbi:MAG: methyltetrahydrofolate--corrinoid methyltransferase [Firmicutes bacterium HGW-Firmicutes-14]|nr:MAG: methyltetrahydrofolate--corrinoid methyltransferase [Firmicutes bacterium HGW-Firmicutes-14]